MRYILYILFFSTTAFAQQDSIQVTVRNIEGRPNATFLQTLQNQMPNCFTIGVGNPNDFYNTYKITQADRDSIYASVFNSFIVQGAIKANFMGKSKLYERGYELEFVSLLLSDSITNDVKKKLLTSRILADWQYDEAHGRPKGWDIRHNLNDVVNLNGNELTIITEGKSPGKEDRNRGLVDFVLRHLDLNFSRILYVIDAKPHQAKDIKRLQELLRNLQKSDMWSFSLLTGAKASAIFGSHAANGLIIISSNN